MVVWYMIMMYGIDFQCIVVDDSLEVSILHYYIVYCLTSDTYVTIMDT